MGNTRCYPKDSELLKKSRYCVKDASGSGYNTSFTRIVFEMQTESSPTYEVVQYLGDHTLSIPRLHGNSKEQTLPFHATTASVKTEVKTLVQYNPARTVYIRQTLGRHSTRISRQTKCAQSDPDEEHKTVVFEFLKIGPDPLY